MNKKASTTAIIVILGIIAVCLVITAINSFDKSNQEDIETGTQKETIEPSKSSTQSKIPLEMGVTCTEAELAESILANQWGLTKEEAGKMACIIECEEENENYTYSSKYCSGDKFYCECQEKEKIEEVDEEKLKTENPYLKPGYFVCPDEIVPETMELTQDLRTYETYISKGEELYSKNTYGRWKDGQKMLLFRHMSAVGPNMYNFCHQGYQEGENVNLVYCNEVTYNKVETLISEEGIVGKTKVTNYLVDFILEKGEQIGVYYNIDGEQIASKYKIISAICKNI